MSLRGLASFTAGLGTGYLNQLRRNDDLARQDRLDAMREKEFGLREQEHALRIDEANAAKRQREAQAEMDRVEAEALAPVAPKQVALANYSAPNPDGSTTPKSAIQPDADAAQNAINVMRQEGDVPGDKAGVSTGYQVRALGGRKNLYAGVSAAADAAKFAQENQGSSYARHMDLVDRLSAIPGGRKRAEEIMTKAKALRQEGVMDALHLVDQGRPEDALALFNSTGTVKAPDGAVIKTDRNAKDFLGRPGVHQLVGADGSVLVPDIRAYALSHIFTPHEGAALERATNRDAVADSRDERDFGLREKSTNATIRNQEGMLALHRDSASRANAAASGEGAIKKAESILGRKLTGAERERLAGFGRDEDQISKFASEAALSGVKSGTVQPEEAASVRSRIIRENAGNTGAAKLKQILDQAKASGNLQAVIDQAVKAGVSPDAIKAIGY